MDLTKAQFAVKVAIEAIKDRIEENEEVIENPHNFFDEEECHDRVKEVAHENALLLCAIEYIKEAFKV